jgi:hypothetical protein
VPSYRVDGEDRIGPHHATVRGFHKLALTWY